MKKNIYTLFAGLIIVSLFAACTPIEGDTMTVWEKAGGGKADTGLRWTVKFDSNGGSMVTNQSVKDGEMATHPQEPTRTDWYFVRWCSDPDCLEEYDFTTPVTANITLYADWSPSAANQWLVRYFSMGGSAVDSVQVVKGTTVAKPDPDPTRDDYVFDGWYEDVSAWNKLWNFNDPVTKDMDLYAKWVAISKVTFDANDKTGRKGTEASIYGEIPQTLTTSPLIAPANPFTISRGRIFAGWAKTAGAVVPDYLTGDTISFADFGVAAGEPVTLYAVWTANTTIVGTTLEDQLGWLFANAISNETYTINVSSISGSRDIVTNNNIFLDPAHFGNETKITIELGASAPGTTVKLNRKGSIFIIGNSFTFVLSGGLILEGYSGNDSAFINVSDGGTFKMTGGIITSNTNTRYGGGGVMVDGGTFIMEGGTIKENISSGGGGVCVGDGTFTMVDGTISDNDASENGGGVFLGDGTFTMIGGTISNNTATYQGGGVAFESYSIGDSKFIMSGGTISGNNAYSNSDDGGGGGVFVQNGIFNISSNALIDNNKANYSGGGGVSIMNGSITMSGGTISNNNANKDGGGVNIVMGNFTMSGGNITGNTTANNGGGVAMSYSILYEGSFTMNDGIISGNTAANNGGGVAVDYYTNFTKTAGTIYGDTGDANYNKNNIGVGYQGNAVFLQGTSTEWPYVKSAYRNATAGTGDVLTFDRSASQESQQFSPGWTLIP